MKQRILRGALIALSLALVACAGEPRLPDDSVAPNQPEKPFQIAEGDHVRVSVWNNPDLSIETVVRPDGNITVPLMGDVQAGGKEPKQLAAEIEQRLSTFLRAPKVTVALTSLEGQEFLRRIRVTGAVGEDVSIPYRRGMTVLDAVLEAGSVSEFAAENDTKVHRRVGGHTETYDVRLRDIMKDGDMKTNVILMPGDIVTVPEGLF